MPTATVKNIDTSHGINPLHQEMANSIRALAMDAVEQAKSGHPGMPMGMADVATVLWSRFLRYNPEQPDWPDRDRFILSAGHGSMLLYALTYLTGFKKMTIDEIKKFRQLGSLTPGHPEHDVSLGVETTTGPLGQGIANAVGFALAERLLNARFSDELVNHHTYVMASDGDLMEGISHEACSLAGHLGLGRLIVYYDDNKISIDGPTNLSFSEDVLSRFRSYGWHVQSIDGHDPAAIISATDEALSVQDKPSLIACRTVIGFGSPKKQGTKDCHGSPLGADEIEATRQRLGWTFPPFVIPEHLMSEWRQAGKGSLQYYQSWQKRYSTSAQRQEFDHALSGALPANLGSVMTSLKQKYAAERPKWATRQSSGAVLEAVLPMIHELIGGSSDLTPSNNTQVKNFTTVSSKNFAGRYIHFGVREHAMASIMNGLALHTGIIPYGGTFLQFADYCRPAIRLSALMRQRVVYVMTHDSIGLGEDGPTHQPVEHLAALRAIPNLYVMRPCDAVETVECWDIALHALNHPSLLSLTRQAVPTLRSNGNSTGLENFSGFGAYVLDDVGGTRQLTLMATGSEVALAVEAKAALTKLGIDTAVISMPCWALFEQQDNEYKKKVLGTAPRIAIEAGIRQGWDRYLGENGVFIGMIGFGASAPADQLYKHFGITVDAIVTAARKLCQ